MAKLYKYRVSLPGIKGFARVYLLSDSSSLYVFHKAMRSDMDFPLDQIVLFKAVDEKGEAKARFSVKDLGCGTIDAVTIGDCRREGLDHFHYFYDTTNRKSVLVDFVEEVVLARTLSAPLLLEAESLGPNPVEFEKGYVAIEDLPDEKRKKIMKGVDEEDEEEMDDEDDFDGEEDEFGNEYGDEYGGEYENDYADEA